MKTQRPVYVSPPESRDSSSTPLDPGKRTRRPPKAAVTVRYEVVVVAGPEGRYLRERQAEAILRALHWFIENSGDQTDELDVQRDL